MDDSTSCEKVGYTFFAVVLMLFIVVGPVVFFGMHSNYFEAKSKEEASIKLPRRKPRIPVRPSYEPESIDTITPCKLNIIYRFYDGPLDGQTFSQTIPLMKLVTEEEIKQYILLEFPDEKNEITYRFCGIAPMRNRKVSIIMRAEPLGVANNYFARNFDGNIVYGQIRKNNDHVD